MPRVSGNYLQDAFDQVVQDAKQPEGHYVCLIEHTRAYGGPEEGGWYTSDHLVAAYRHCATAEEAEHVKAAVEAMAKELEQEARRDHGQHCLNQMEWLDARGLDADFLPEDDGPSTYTVEVHESLPQSRYGNRHYE